MSVRDEIEGEKNKLQELCRSIGVPALRVKIDADQWSDVTFIGDVDTARLKGYAERFFSLEEGLVRIFHRRVNLLDQEMFEGMQARHNGLSAHTAPPIELLHAS
jgi:hypothetical protein